MKEADTIRKGVAIPASLAQEIDDFRFERRYRTDADVLRALIEAGLKSLKAESKAPADASA